MRITEPASSEGMVLITLLEQFELQTMVMQDLNKFEVALGEKDRLQGTDRWSITMKINSDFGSRGRYNQD